jgi:hypothetical protein
LRPTTSYDNDAISIGKVTLHFKLHNPEARNPRSWELIAQAAAFFLSLKSTIS